MRLKVVTIAIVLMQNLGIVAADSPSISATVSAGQLTVTALSSGGSVAVSGLTAHNERGMLSKQSIARVLTDDDRDGRIVYAPAAGIPFQSVFVVVDLVGGTTTVVAPEGYSVDHHEIGRAALKKDQDGLVSALELDQLHAEILIVRPGEGAWVIAAHDGGGGSADGIADGRLSIQFEQARSLVDPDQKAPKKLKKGDVLAVIDPAHFEVRTVTVQP